MPMKSLICSDLHDHIANFQNALGVVATSQCDSVICCGDLCSPFMLDFYHAHCDQPFHAVFGNNDGDRFNLAKKAALINQQRPPEKQLFLHGEYLLAMAGHQLAGIPPESGVAIYHYPEMARIMARSGDFKIVCYGHSHRTAIEKLNNTLLVNPGSVMGYIPGTEATSLKLTCIIVNWITGEMELLEL